tara:strand:+ start:1021 stop:1230 length:210 start_codon:yes stop_codon:yes gene_type:complete
MSSEIEFLEELEDLVNWNLSFGISIKDTLIEENQLEWLSYFMPIINEVMEEPAKKKVRFSVTITEMDTD